MQICCLGTVRGLCAEIPHSYIAFPQLFIHQCVWINILRSDSELLTSHLPISWLVRSWWSITTSQMAVTESKWDAGTWRLRVKRKVVPLCSTLLLFLIVSLTCWILAASLSLSQVLGGGWRCWALIMKTCLGRGLEGFWVNGFHANQLLGSGHVPQKHHNKGCRHCHVQHCV